jgi:hypothetical protein
LVKVLGYGLRFEAAGSLVGLAEVPGCGPSVGLS